MAPTPDDERIHKIGIRNKLLTYVAGLFSSFGLALIGAKTIVPISKDELPNLPALLVCLIAGLAFLALAALCIMSHKVEK